MFHGGSRRLKLELSFTRSPVSEVTVRRFGAKVFCWLSTTPQILTLLTLAV